MSISEGNSKLGRISNISLVPIKDCANCGFCRDDCYAKKFYRMYPGVKKSWTENSVLAKRNPAQYFHNIIDYCQTKKPKYFRWHVGGDILNQRYLQNMKNIASLFPQIHFLCFTKRFDLDYNRLPNNLKMFFSIWPTADAPRAFPKGVKLSWMQDGTETRIPANAKECNGNCMTCMRCWGDNNNDVVFHLH